MQLLALDIFMRKKNLSEGYFNFAFMFENGFGCKKNLQEAARYYKMAADKRNYEAKKKVEQLRNNEDCLIPY